MEAFALITPSVNRVYGAAAATLAVAELRFVGLHVAPGSIESVDTAQEAGLEGLRIRICDDAWETPATRQALLRTFARSPHVFAVFEEMGRMPLLDGADAVASAGEVESTPAESAGSGGSETPGERVYVDEMPSVPLLQPHPLPDVNRYPSDLLTTLKYQGKTNEQFTALMLHLAAAASQTKGDLNAGTLRVLDPVAGRGTTLNQALMWGLSPVGVDIDKKDAELYRAFLTGWLREHRYKHTAQAQKLTVNKKALGSQFHAELAVSKEAAKAGQQQSLELYTADTTNVGAFIKARSIDAIVADLPYGVQHGARSGASLQRSPLELLSAALPAWKGTLREGAAMALAFNRYTASFEAVAELLAKHGLTVLNNSGDFRHRVDASIDRDIVIARR